MASTSKQKGKNRRVKGHGKYKGKDYGKNYLLITEDYESVEPEKLRNAIENLGYNEDALILSWPINFGIKISKEQIVSAKTDIMKALIESPNTLSNVLKPNKTKQKSWLTQCTPNIDDLEKAKEENASTFTYVESEENSDPVFILGIDDTNDEDEKIRERFTEQQKKITEENQKRCIDNFLVHEENYGGDLGITEYDKGKLPEPLKQEKAPDTKIHPEYYPPQIYLAEKVVERIKVIYRQYHKKTLESFNRFDFVIHTADINMLEQQTYLRLSKKESGCFPAEIYEESDIKARKMAKERVQKYERHAKDSDYYKEFCDRVSKEKETLFLVVADEAHWGATEKGSNTQFINKWNTKDHPNVVVFLVTATPYNLLTENSRIPVAYYDPTSCKNESPTVRVIENQRDMHSLITKGYKELHRVRWSECFEAKVKEGIIVKLRIPRPTKTIQLYIQNKPGCTGIKPCEKKRNISDPSISWEEEFLMQGDGRHVRITTIDEKSVFVVRDKTCGFVCIDNIQEVDISSFQMHLSYGEGLILLSIPGMNEGKKETFFFLDDKTGQIAPEPRPKKLILDDYASPDLINSFLIEECRTKRGFVKEYISLNHYFNSMRNEKHNDQLLRMDIDGIRDKVLRTDTKNAKSGRIKSGKKSGPTKKEKSDILCAEYSYYIILINMIRKYPLKSDFIQTNFEQFLQSIQDYYYQCKICINKFTEQLKKVRTMKWCTIKEKVFNDLSTEVIEDIKSNFENNLKGFEKNSTDDKAYKLFSSIVSCLLHSISVDENKITSYLKEIETHLSIEGVNEKLSNICKRKADDFCFEKTVENALLKSETGRIVYRMIPKSFDIMNGCMILFRSDSCESGDKIYNTLCIARKLSSEFDYSFEILRDYSHFKLEDDSDCLQGTNGEEDQDVKNPRYRIRVRLQTKKCSHITIKTQESCRCIYEGSENLEQFDQKMKCKSCGHTHKIIKTYEDLDKLPCILILVNKGRMGDTFPHSLQVVDSRLCYAEVSQSITLETIVQELGRMCRYQAKSYEDPLPYALIGKHLEIKLQDALRIGAPFHSILHSDSLTNLGRRLVMKKMTPKEYIYGNRNRTSGPLIFANKNHFDFENKEKHNNRILLGAEPQIGKTGVYLRVISILQSIFSPDKSYENDQKQEKSEESESMQDKSDESEDDASYWRYPLWKDPLLRTTVVKKSKYYRFYGRYKHGKIPPKCMLKRSAAIKLGKNKEIQRDEVQAYTLGERRSCEKCSGMVYETVNFKLTLQMSRRQSLGESQESDRMTEDWEFAENRSDESGQDQVEYEISIPMIPRYKDLISRIKQDKNVKNFPTPITGALKLKSWIFIPTYNRSDSAYINLYHTMMEGNSECSYTSILVVRSTDFQQYCTSWQSQHAILQIPNSWPGAERNYLDGGIGYVRLSIQIFAEALKLDWIFMVDDNIMSVSEVIETDSTVKREEGRLKEKKVPLFKVLKHIENQVDGSIENPPEIDFPRYSDAHSDIRINPHEDYTGPSDNYGVIGIKSHSQYSRYVRAPFLRTHVSALVFLNINALNRKQIRYKPWPVFEDLNLNNDCDKKDLWVCKYNRFSFRKHYMKTWLPDMYIWDDTCELGKGFENALDSDNISNKYLRSTKINTILPKCIEQKEEFRTILRNINKLKNGKYALIAAEKVDILQSTLSTNSHNHFLILMSSKLCIEEELTNKALIQKWLEDYIQNTGTIACCEVLSSHNINLFIVKHILIELEVARIRDGMEQDSTGLSRTADDIALDSKPSTSKKRLNHGESAEKKTKFVKENKDQTAAHNTDLEMDSAASDIESD